LNPSRSVQGVNRNQLAHDIDQLRELRDGKKSDDPRAHLKLSVFQLRNPLFGTRSQFSAVYPLLLIV
jgi:hypothetical protein